MALLMDKDYFWREWNSRSECSVESLLSVMRGDHVSDQQLISNHMSLMSSSGKIAKFYWLYEKYKLLKTLDHACYKIVHHALDELAKGWKDKA